jgi:glycosyltransferase involved in cell wall biosynthesis
MNPEVSIILLMKNEADFLDETLRSVFAQKTDRPFEVIAVDSGSRDRTVEIARLFEKVSLLNSGTEKPGTSLRSSPGAVFWFSATVMQHPRTRTGWRN